VKRTLVEPRTVKGLQDVLPEACRVRRAVTDVIERVFQRYGFLPLDTPAIEYLDTLLGTGGENINKELFRFESPEGETVALRFDLTVPFARLLAQYPDKIKTPFRRYAIGPVWRADKPGPWRFRQFTQLDADVAGADTVAVDAELVAIVHEIMQGLGARLYTVLINNRKLIDAMLESCGVAEPDRHKHILRVIDKLAKVGIDNVRLELGPGRIDESGDPIPGVKLDEPTIDRICEFIYIAGQSRAEVVSKLEAALPDSPLAADALAEMRECDAALTALNVPDAHAQFTPSLARGLDYYTGLVFEIVFPDAPEFGSVGGGGRYNGLVDRFDPQSIPCTGISLGLERLLGALAHVGAAPPCEPATQVLVVTMGNVPRAETLKIAAELRAGGLRTEAFFASKKKMKMSNQLSHADWHGIPVAVIIGEDELANDQVSVKDLFAGKAEREDIEDREAYLKAGKTGQVTVPRSEMLTTVRAMLA
jgi:histidyl-tRNA synthetase